MAAARARYGRGEESPGSTGPGCRVTPGGGDPRESATENIPPAPHYAERPVRVKRCGKSAPPGRQRRGQGKPHPEQDHVGTRVARWRYVRARQARFRADVRVGCLTGPATAPLDEWPSPGNRYRTRLTGHLAVLPPATIVDCTPVGTGVWPYISSPDDSGATSDRQHTKTRTKTELYRESDCFSVSYTTTFKLTVKQLRTLAFPMKKQLEPIDGQYFP